MQRVQLQTFRMVLVLVSPEYECVMVIQRIYLCRSFQALGCSVEVPIVSVCELLDQLIDLFCFYNGSVRQSYQVRCPLYC